MSKAAAVIGHGAFLTGQIGQYEVARWYRPGYSFNASQFSANPLKVKAPRWSRPPRRAQTCPASWQQAGTCPRKYAGLNMEWPSPRRARSTTRPRRWRTPPPRAATRMDLSSAALRHRNQSRAASALSPRQRPASCRRRQESFHSPRPPRRRHRPGRTATIRSTPPAARSPRSRAAAEAGRTFDLTAKIARPANCARKENAVPRRISPPAPIEIHRWNPPAQSPPPATRNRAQQSIREKPPAVIGQARRLPPRRLHREDQRPAHHRAMQTARQSQKKCRREVHRQAAGAITIGFSKNIPGPPPSTAPGPSTNPRGASAH